VRRSAPLHASAVASGPVRSIRQEFAEDRIVTVDGWVLSITETRLYALADLV
jgi:hypothetical protein